jgi:outer membrane protein OmpA-like peptidoglycan-associated protein/opacity protein-like surface antigen
MRFLTIALALLTVGSSTAFAQWSPDNPEDTSRFDVSAGYSFVRANAPPGGCECFNLQGAYLSGGFHINNWLSIEAEASGEHAKDISQLGQDLTLITFAAGPKAHWAFGRFDPFGQVLVGGAHGSDSYFPTGTSTSPTAASFAVQAGGGVDYMITERFSARLDAQYLKTELPNGTNNEQSQLMAGVGIVFRFNSFSLGFGGHEKEEKEPPPPPPAAPEGQIALTCSSNVDRVDPGDTLEIFGKTLTEPTNLPVTYTWTSAAGAIVGSGDHVTLDTQGIAPGTYHVLGHASAEGPTLLTADCDVSFQIKTPAQAVQAPTPAPAAPAAIDPAKNREFHENVPDALFDYDSYAIRPDAQVAINHAAAYLQAHPEIGVLIGGFADDRGSAEYNLVLGQERAESARKALITAGVAPERLQIISYGKEVQVCTAENEACRQQNRRAEFSMHP